MRAASHPHRKRHPRSFSTRNSTELWQCLQTTNARVNNMSKGMTLSDAVHAHSRAPRVDVIEALDSTGSLREDGMSTAYNLHAVLARPNSRKDVRRLQSSSDSRPKVVRPPSPNAGGGRLGDELMTSFGDKSLHRMSSMMVMSRTGATADSRRDDGEATQRYSSPAVEQVAEMFEDVRSTPKKQDWLSAKSSISAAQAFGLRGGSSGGSRGGGARPATSSLSRSESLPTASMSTVSRRKKTATLTRDSIGFRAETPEQKLLAKRLAYGNQRPRTSGTPYRALPKGTSIELRHHGYVQFMRDVNKSDDQANIEEALAIGHNEETTAAQRIEHNLRKMEMRRAGHDALDEMSIMSPNTRKLSSLPLGTDPQTIGSPVSPPGSPMSALPAEVSALFGPDPHNTKEVKHIEFHFNDLPEARLHYGTLVALEVRADIFITMERPLIPGQHGKFVAKHSRHRTPRDEWVFRVMDMMNPESSRPVCWDDAIWLKAGGEAMKHAKDTPLIVVMGAKLVQPQTLPVVNIDSSVLEGFKQRESELEKCGEPIALHTPFQKGRVQNRKNTAKGDNIGKWKIRSINPALRHAPVPTRLKDASRAKKAHPSHVADPELENLGSAKEQHILNFNEVYFEQDFFYLANEIPQGGDIGELFLKPYNKEELHGETPDRPAIVTLRIVLEASSASSSKDQKKAFAVTSEATTLLSQSILNRNGGRKYITKSADQNETNITGGARFTTELRKEIANTVARNEHESLIPHMEKEQSMKHLVVAHNASNRYPNAGLPFHSGLDGFSHLDGGGSTLSSLEEHHFIIGGASSLASAGNMARSTDDKMKSGAAVQLVDGHVTEGDSSVLEPKRSSILDRINERMKDMNTEDGLIQILAAEANMVMEQEAAEEAETAAKAAAGDKFSIIKQKMGKDPHSPTAAKLKAFAKGGHRATTFGNAGGRGSGRSGGAGTTFNFGSNVKNLISLLKREKIKSMDEAIDDALKQHFSVNTLRGEMRMEDKRTQSYISYKDHKMEMNEIMDMIKTLSGAGAAEKEVDIRLARKNRQKLEKQKQKEELARLSLADGKCIDISLAMATFGNDKGLLSTMVASVCNAYIEIWEPALSKCMRNLEFKRILTVLSILDVASDTFAGTGLRERTLDVIDLVTDASEHALHTLAERNEVREVIIEKLEAMHEMMVSLAYLPVSLAPPSPGKKKSAAEDENPGVLPLINGQHIPGWRSFYK